MEDLWGPIDVELWHHTPCISGRAATEADVQAGLAVFYVQGESTPATIALPCCAIESLEDGTTQRVLVIQADVAPYGTVLGVRPLAGGNGVCTLEEVQLVPSGFLSSADA